MIDERPYRYLRGQLGHSPGMVRVIVGEQYIIDAADAGCLRRSGDPVSVASFIARPARIDQQRVLGRSHKERSLSAFHINKINL